MNRNPSRVARLASAALLMFAAGACNDINRQTSPVSLVVSTTQNLTRIDLAGDVVGSTKCQETVGTVHMTSVPIQAAPLVGNPNLTGADLNQIKIDRYRVSYARVDGGHLVPAPFVRSISTVIAVGQTGEGTNFVVFDPGAVFQAPFAALLPQNGGRDPETGRPVVTMDVILEVFGTTLAGERVSGSTRMTIDFCFSCGGCA